MAADYIDTPCSCKENDRCPHYGRVLVGRVWELSRDTTELGRQYRAYWSGHPLPEEPPPDPTRWPLAARALARLRGPRDRGLGDTAARVLKRFGADKLAWLYRKLTGRECGCWNRQAALNTAFPYPPEPPP